MLMRSAKLALWLAGVFDRVATTLHMQACRLRVINSRLVMRAIILIANRRKP